MDALLIKQMQEYAKILLDGCHVLFEEYQQGNRISVHILNCATCKYFEESLDEKVRMLKTWKYCRRHAMFASITPFSIAPFNNC